MRGCRRRLLAVKQVAQLQVAGSSSAIETTSSASHVGPNTEQICVGPRLNDFMW